MATMFLLDLAGYVGLLLWGTRMVTTGVQRGFGAALRVWLEHNRHQRWRAFLAGVGLTVLLQAAQPQALWQRHSQAMVLWVLARPCR